MTNRPIVWKELTGNGKQTTVTRVKERQDLDNDAPTIEKERSAFQQWFSKLDPRIAVVDVARDEDDGGDSFILTTSSMAYLERIVAFFKETNAVQYEVKIGEHAVPIADKPTIPLKPVQRTVVVYRKALKKLKRSPCLTLFYSTVCMLLISYLLSLVYRIAL